MFGTINYNSFYIFTGIMIGLTIISLVIITIISIREIFCYGSCCGLFIGIIIIVYVLMNPIFNTSWRNQSKNNIKEAIRDEYNNTKNIVIEDDKGYKGYFSSNDENYSFEVIDNTLVIKNGETVVKYISGDNY